MPIRIMNGSTLNMVMKFCHFAPASILIICNAVKRMIMATATMRTTIWLNPVKNAR